MDWILSRPSPNHGARPLGVVIDCIVLHADAAPAVAESLDWLRTKHPNPSENVSYHYLIGRTGSIYQLVPDERRAWHAGVSSFHGRTDCNDYSIGVSFGNRNDGKEPYPMAQMRAGAELCAEMMRRHPAITLDRITTHAAVAMPPGRKTDPGPRFVLGDFLMEIRRFK